MTKTVVSSLAFILLSWLTIAAQSTQTSLRPKIQTIVRRLAKEDILHLGAPVGDAGVPETHNKYYKLFQKLKSKARTEELIKLTEDSSKVIVLYSFNILNSRGYTGLKEIFINHLIDTAYVWMAASCTGSVDKVNSYMLGFSNPKYHPSGNSFLTETEYEKYSALIDKTYKRQ